MCRAETALTNCVYYHFFIICDNNDAKQFHIEATCMRDYRLRFSAIKSQYKRQLKGHGPSKPWYSLFEGDYSYHLMESGLCAPSDVPDLVSEMTAVRLARYQDSVRHTITGVISLG